MTNSTERLFDVQKENAQSLYGFCAGKVKWQWPKSPKRGLKHQSRTHTEARFSPIRGNAELPLLNQVFISSDVTNTGVSIITLK